jgi:hypothetical protein
LNTGLVPTLKGTDLGVGVIFYGIICHAEGFGPLLVQGCDHIVTLTSCKPKTCSKTLGLNIKFVTSLLRFDIGSGPEASPRWVQGNNCLQAFIHASYKTDGDANGEAVVIKFAVP